MVRIVLQGLTIECDWFPFVQHVTFSFFFLSEIHLFQKIFSRFIHFISNLQASSVIRGKIWGPCWLKIHWQGAAGGAVMGHCICVRERWWWVALKSDGPWNTDGVHCLTTTAVEHTAQCATHTPVNAQNCSLQTMWSDAQLLCIILRETGRDCAKVLEQSICQHDAATHGWVPVHSVTYTQLTHEMTREGGAQYTGSTVSILCKRPKWHRLHPWTCHPVHPATETD